MKWQKGEEIELLELLKEGKNYIEIEEILNRSKNSIRNKSQKMGYSLQSFKIQNKKCIFCKKNFNYNCRDEKERSKIFCNSSCSASYNNKLRNKKGKSVRYVIRKLII